MQPRAADRLLVAAGTRPDAAPSAIAGSACWSTSAVTATRLLYWKVSGTSARLIAFAQQAEGNALRPVVAIQIGRSGHAASAATMPTASLSAERCYACRARPCSAAHGKSRGIRRPSPKVFISEKLKYIERIRPSARGASVRISSESAQDGDSEADEAVPSAYARSLIVTEMYEPKATSRCWRKLQEHRTPASRSVPLANRSTYHHHSGRGPTPG